VAVNPAEAVRLLTELRARWAARRGEIVTADIRFREMSSTSFTPIHTPEAVAAIVAKYDLASRPEAMEALVLELRGVPLNRHPPRVMCRAAWDGSSKYFDQGGVFRHITHGELDLIYDGDNDQADVYLRGQSRRRFRSELDFRWIPPAELPADTYRVVSRDGDRVSVVTKSGHDKSIYQLSTGLRLHWSTTRAETGDVREQSWTQGVSHFDGDVPFPTATIIARYSEGLMSGYEVRIVEDAIFNGPISADVFQSKLAAGSVVVDHRGTEKSAFRQRETTTDLASTLLAPDATPDPRGPYVPPDDSFPTRWVLALNGLFLVVIGILMWRRDRRRLDKRVAEAEDKSKTK
jgi:hypothetical protein